MQEKITIFHAQQRNGSKIPLSNYDDNTFVFETYTASSNLEMYSVMVSHFILNIPLSLQQEPIRTFRRKANLNAYYKDCVDYIILDIDDVKSEFDKQQILEYFKDYKVILGESKSYNGINCFNMKGILFTECIDFTHIKQALSIIHHDLKEVCTIDESVCRKASLNAPIMKNNVFLNNEDGIRLSFVEEKAEETIEQLKREYIGEGLIFDIEELNNIEADNMEKLCLKVFQSMGFKALKNNQNGSITFSHPSEEKTPGGFFWFSSSPYTMHHGNTTRTINIFDTVRKLPAAKEIMKKDINYDSEFLEFNTDTKVISVNEKYLEVTNEIANTIQEFLSHEDGLLSIRSPMGTGKSTIINHIVNECHEEDMKVLIVTNRISVAQDFGKKYGMKVYNQDKYEIGDSLICQYDSLWKYNIKFFDIIIMDEFISLMMHSRSNLNNSSVNISKFFGCFNKKLVIADAFLTGYENFLLNNKETNIHLIDNNYRDPTTIYSYDDFNYFVNSLVYHSQKNKITVSATSLNFINSLSLLLSKKGLKVIKLTADTPESTKELVYKLFEKDDHDKWDVLIYSPTLTVGVSNLNNVGYHFHYDSAMSTDVVSSLQMIKRTRKSKEIHMFVKEKINYLKTSYNDIRDEYMGNIGKNIEQNYLFDIDDYGEAKLSNVGKKAIKIDTFKNILSFNHKGALMWMMQYHFLYEPRIIDQTFSSNILSKYQNEVRNGKEEVLQNNVAQYLELNDMEKTALLMDSSTDKTMRILAEIGDEINDMATPIIKTKILEHALTDNGFIKKCRYYKVAFNYTKGIYDDTDVKALVSKSVINGQHDDLHFYNVLLSYGQKEIFEDYSVKTINKNKQLKYLLDKCGYKKDTHAKGSVTSVGVRGYTVDKMVREYYGFIK
jgi:hypothetical protein